MTSIKKIKSLKGAGVLADKTPRDASIEFRRFNLIYGFNGSGKSTVSRIMACLQIANDHPELPENCTFEIEFQDGSVLGHSTTLAGHQDRVCVFNADFVASNLRWKEGTATSIFYISEAQAQAAADLRAAEAELPLKEQDLRAKGTIARDRLKSFNLYRTERAKVIAAHLHLGTRRYEANHLKADYDSLAFDERSLLTAEALTAVEEVAKLSAAPPPLEEINLDFEATCRMIQNARGLVETSLGTAILDELEHHPTMAQWIKEGHEYHLKHGLETCLHCGERIPEARRDLLTSAFDERIRQFLGELHAARDELMHIKPADPIKVPKVGEVELSLQAAYASVFPEFESGSTLMNRYVRETLGAIDARLKSPTTIVEHGLPPNSQINELGTAATAAVKRLNDLIRSHNENTSDFDKRQEDARGAIKLHFLAEGDEQYSSASAAVSEADEDVANARLKVAEVEQKVADLRMQVRAHGPAAEKITALMRAYLGHEELSVVPADEGYELHRHGKLVRGQPSEGEKTAIALCYFISSLEADGRSIKDLIVIVDDPISSLDTRAMNYACALLRSSLGAAEQVFVLTHNHQCMNEFKKAWKPLAYPRNDNTPATGTLCFVDVIMPEGTKVRSSSIVEMSSLLREYDSEYHFLCQKVLEFEAAGSAYSPYSFMMPNVIRRVLEIFLAFKVPGSSPIKDKLGTLCKLHPSLDPTRLVALERLSQVESHSDNLDDLISHSAMTIEETQDANKALLFLMETADKDHTSAIRKQCKPAA